MSTHRLEKFCTKLPICAAPTDKAVRPTLSRSLPAKSTRTSLPKRLMWAGSAALPGRPPCELLRELPVSICSVITQWLRDECSFKRCALHNQTSEARASQGLVAFACSAEGCRVQAQMCRAVSSTGVQ